MGKGKRGGRGGGRKMFIKNVEELELRNQVCRTRRST